MLQRLPIAIAQVKAGNISESSQIYYKSINLFIYYSHRAKETSKKVHLMNQSNEFNRVMK